MRRWAIAALTVAGVMGLGYVHPFGNPRAEPAKGLGTLLQGANIPADAKAVLVTKCADCHSSETRWPVYARVAPGSWLIEQDIVEARNKMDLSRWEEMPAEKQEVLTAKIIEEAKSGDMPPLPRAQPGRSCRCPEQRHPLSGSVPASAAASGLSVRCLGHRPSPMPLGLEDSSSGNPLHRARHRFRTKAPHLSCQIPGKTTS